MNDKSKQNEEQTVTQKRVLPIEWLFPDDLQTKYANQMYVATGETEVMLCFFETLPTPPVSGTKAELTKLLDSIKTVPAQCVARIVLTKERYAAFVQALSSHLTAITEEPEEGKKP